MAVCNSRLAYCTDRFMAAVPIAGLLCTQQLRFAIDFGKAAAVRRPISAGAGAGRIGGVDRSDMQNQILRASQLRRCCQCGFRPMPLDPTILHHIADPGYQAVIEPGAVTAIDRQTGNRRRVTFDDRDRYRAACELARLVGGSWKIDCRFRRDANRHDTGFHVGHWWHAIRRRFNLQHRLQRSHTRRHIQTKGGKP